jgi:pimeloyl-ACP methyl ester carboxylesterase
MIGMVLAAEHPDDFHGLILVDIAPREHPRKMPPRTPPPEWFNSVDDARKYFHNRYPKFTSEAIENRVHNALTRDTEGRLKLKATGDAIRPSLDVNLWPYAERIGVPTLLVLGSESAVVPDESVDRLRRKINDFSVVKLEGATHMVPQDEPEEFKKLVLSFLNNE